MKESFEAEAKIQSPIRRDLEMGNRVPRSDPDLGLESFNKQVNPSADNSAKICHLALQMNLLQNHEIRSTRTNCFISSFNVPALVAPGHQITIDFFCLMNDFARFTDTGG